MVQFTRSASYEVDPRGHFAVEHAYVQYFVPERRRDVPPLVMIHGGGLSGTCWETTPDGRPGWLHLALDHGFEVHIVDNVERGRAGFAPGLWDGRPILRSLEEAWVLFRFGAATDFTTRAAFTGQRFPVETLEAFARSFVPRWLGTGPLQTRAFLEVLRRLGSATVICHSQGGEVVFDALSEASEAFHGIIALEPSALPPDRGSLKDLPMTLVAGDFLDIAPHWEERAAGWAQLSRSTPTVNLLETKDVAPGHSHMLMMDRGCDDLFEAVISGFL
jgi:pimeloyl-ACP methyl ester carboxylesterase